MIQVGESRKIAHNLLRVLLQVFNDAYCNVLPLDWIRQTRSVANENRQQAEVSTKMQLMSGSAFMRSLLDATD